MQQTENNSERIIIGYCQYCLENIYLYDTYITRRNYNCDNITEKYHVSCYYLQFPQGEEYYE